MNKILMLLAVALPCFIFSACGDEDDDVFETGQESYVVTGSVSDLDGRSAVVSGFLNVSLEVLSGASFGIVYSTQSDVAVEKYNSYTKEASSLEGNKFSVIISLLTPNTKYYYRAYYKMSNSVYVYGRVQSFTTGAYAVKAGKAVDLGLSVKWADMNVGASSPEDYGDYFAWGETEPKDDYSWSTYKHCKGAYKTLTKYCDNSSYGYNGFTDTKTTLDPEDDAATVNWGAGWRMPTRAEQDELRDKCTWRWTTQGGVNGYSVKGPNGNSIFLPAAGGRFDADLPSVGSYGGYWSSSLNTRDPGLAYSLGFASSGINRVYGDRYCGISVRPVCQ